MLALVQQLALEADPTAIRLGGLLHRVGHALYQLSGSSLGRTTNFWRSGASIMTSTT